MPNSTPLKVIVIGGGIMGLAAAGRLAQSGHTVRVLERKSKLTGGGGIQLSPNAQLAFQEWGLAEEMDRVAEHPDAHRFRRYADGQLLAEIPLATRSRPGAWLLHRDDILECLYRAALKYGVTVSYNKQMTAVNASQPSVTLDDGSVLTCDLIIGADGIESAARAVLNPGSEAKALLTAHVDFIVEVPRAHMQQHESTSRLYDTSFIDLWMGPERWVLAWPMYERELYSVYLGDHGFGLPALGERYISPGDMELVRKRFRDFDPSVVRMLEGGKNCLKWRIHETPSLQRWTSDDGRLVLLGDAAHAMTPNTGQGASMGIEDVYVYTELLSRLGSLPEAAKLYQELRQPRVDRVQELARGNGVDFTLPDGVLQQQRDARLADWKSAISTEQRIEPDASERWGSPALREWMFGYNVVKVLGEFLESRARTSLAESTRPVMEFGNL